MNDEGSPQPWILDRCPITGLPITRKPEWTDQNFGVDGYRITTSLVGTNIIYTKVWGYTDLHACQEAVALLERVMEHASAPEATYVLIEDYRDHVGASSAARTYYTSFIRRHPQVRGLLFCSASAVFKIMIKMGRRVARPAFPVEIVDDYAPAIQVAQRWLQRRPPRGLDGGEPEGGARFGDHMPPTDRRRAAMEPTHPRERASEGRTWSVALDGISCTCRLLPDDILLYAAAGNLEERHVEPLFALYEQAITESGLAAKGPIDQIADWRGLGQGSLHARRRFIERFRASVQRYPCRSYVVFGLSRMLRTVVAIMGQFVPVRLSVAATLDDAIDIIRRRRAAKAAIEGTGDATTPPSGDDTPQSIEALLRFMGEIDWDVDGTGLVEPPLPPSHPFKPLFEATTLIKQDFDVLLREKDRAEELVEEQNRFNSLRAEIWKIAALRSLDERALIQRLLEEIGPAFGVGRVRFLTPTQGDRDPPRLTCAIEWCQVGVTPTLGQTVPAWPAEPFAGREWISITPHEVFDAIRRPLAPFLSATDDLDSTSLLAFRVDDAPQGWFAFDICRNQPDKPAMTEEMSRIAQEMVTIVANNVTQRRAEEQLKRAYAEMEQTVVERTQELQTAVAIAEMASRAKGDFLANMSHEIRTPLNGIMGFAQIIERSPSVDGRAREQAERITAECRRLMALINGVLDLAKIEAGKMQIEARAFSLRALLEELASAFRVSAAEKRLEFSVGLDASVQDQLIGDDLRVRQVLMNLIGNAIKFTRKGSVAVTVETSQDRDDTVTLIFWIKDTGIGIPAEKLDFVFESFIQADSATTREFGGTGLGTTICRQLVELMGGMIGVESAVGKGSAFWFTLPFGRAASAGEVRPAGEAGAAPVSLHGARILLVEDYPTNQEVARYLLESASGVVLIADNGLVALEMFAEQDFDIILMDVQMPKMDGYDATRAIRKLPRGATIPILGMTANVFEKDRQACQAAGMNDFIPKPLEFRQTLDIIARWLQGARTPAEPPARTAAADATPPPTAPAGAGPVDVAAYVERMGGNREIAEVIIRGFIAEIPKQIRNIAAAIEAGDIKTVDREAHSMKGGASNVFANGVLEAAKALEMHAKSGSLEQARELLEAVGTQYERLRDYELDFTGGKNTR